MPRSLLILPILAILTAPSAAAAQSLRVAAGVGAGSIPRALHPLCGAARRLKGAAAGIRGGVNLGRFDVGASVEHVTRLGVSDAAECVPRSGLNADSVFAVAGRSATTIALSGWSTTATIHPIRIGGEVGVVVGHSSWFVGPAVGAVLGRLRIEAAARRHVTRFDEITRDYTSNGVTEISRRPLTDAAWGGVVRLLMTF
jgi:hypothetical protein